MRSNGRISPGIEGARQDPDGPDTSAGLRIAQPRDEKRAQERGQVLGKVCVSTLGWPLQHRQSQPGERRKRWGGRTTIEGERLGILVSQLLTGVGVGRLDATGATSTAGQGPRGRNSGRRLKSPRRGRSCVSDMSGCGLSAWGGGGGGKEVGTYPYSAGSCMADMLAAVTTWSWTPNE